MRPLPTTFPIYFNSYIKLVEENDCRLALKNQGDQAEEFFNLITEEESNYKYSEGKWTIKEILQHVCDSERIFTYRALAIARKENGVLPSYDENNYSLHTNANNRSWKDLVEEFVWLRKSTIHLYNSFTTEHLKSSGKVSDYTINVLAIGYIIPGHAIHHMNIIRERYISI